MSYLDSIRGENLEVIEVLGGDVSKGLSANDASFKGFGEVYFSKIKHNSVKAWKKHAEMTMNLIVPMGVVRFVFFTEYDNRFHEEIIGEINPRRLLVPPGIWFGFQGYAPGESLVVNIANIIHSEDEITRLARDKIDFNWCCREDLP